VGEVVDRDLELYRDWGRGMRKVDLAAKYHLDRHTVARVLERVKNELPPLDRIDTFDQSVEILDQALAVFTPMMLDGDKAAGRLVDRLIGRRNDMLGLDSPARLELYQAQQASQHERVDVRAELAALVAKIRNQQGGGHDEAA
jgi:hypothetical protein